MKYQSRKLWFGIFIFTVCAGMTIGDHLDGAIFGSIAQACIYAYAAGNVGAIAAKRMSVNKIDDKG